MLIRSSPFANPCPIVLYSPHNIFINLTTPFPPSLPLTHTHSINIFPPIVQKVDSGLFLFAMPAIRPILEYKYQHRQFRHKLKPPYGRSCPPRFGPKFKPTRPIYDEQEPEKIRSILLQRRRVDGKVPLSLFPH